MTPQPNASLPRRPARPPSVLLVTALSLFVACSLRAAPVPDEPEEDPRRAAIAMLEGKAECIIQGVSKPADVGMLVPPGAILKTGKKSEAVLFFRQIGTMVRLRPDTTLVLETMTKFRKDDVLLKETVLNLQAGEMMCVVRVLDERSKFEIKVPGYVATFDGAGKGRFDLNAKGTVLVGKRSERPLRVVRAGPSGEAILVAPGHYLGGSNLKTAVASERMLSRVRPKLDQLEKLANALTPPPRPDELPRARRK